MRWRPNYVVFSVISGAALASLGMTVGLTTAYLVHVVSGLEFKPQPSPSNPYLEFAGSVILAPVIETLLMIALYKAATKWLRVSRRGYTVVGGLAGAISHASRGVPMVLIGVGFAILSFQYAWLRDHRSPGAAFMGTALTHATYNCSLQILVWTMMAIE